MERRRLELELRREVARGEQARQVLHDLLETDGRAEGVVGDPRNVEVFIERMHRAPPPARFDLTGRIYVSHYPMRVGVDLSLYPVDNWADVEAFISMLSGWRR